MLDCPVGPEATDKCPSKRRTERGEGHVKPGAATGVKLLEAKEALEPPEAGGGKDGFFARDFRRGTALLTPSSQTSGLQNGEKIHICCFKPPSLWSFVTAALENDSRQLLG